MSLACLLIGATTLALANGQFELSWQHSVEKTVWRETWKVTGAGLHLLKAAVKGSGAGMDPGPGARLDGEWWVWTPTLPPVPDLTLAASGATEGGWTLCSGSTCQILGNEPDGPLVLKPCH